MKTINRLQTAAAIATGLALAAAMWGGERLCIALLVAVVADLFVCLQLALILASKRENR